MCKQLSGNTINSTAQCTFIKVMTEYICWRILVLTSIGLFFTALCILDACIRSYWIRKQQRRAQMVAKFTSEIDPYVLCDFDKKLIV